MLSCGLDLLLQLILTSILTCLKTSSVSNCLQPDYDLTGTFAMSSSVVSKKLKFKGDKPKKKKRSHRDVEDSGHDDAAALAAADPQGGYSLYAHKQVRPLTRNRD